jgi:creatinine amidohydrolase
MGGDHITASGPTPGTEPSVRLADLTWQEFAACVAAGSLTVILPVGATEQHGPHLPLSTDVVLPVAVAEGVARAIGGLVAPAIPYGYKSQPKSGGGNHFPGTLSLDGATLVAVVRDVVNELARHGVRRIVLLDGHMENQWFLTEAADLAQRDQRREGVRDLRIVKLGYWSFIDPATLAALFEGGPFTWELEHAAVMETSVMLHLRPDLVRTDRVPDNPPAAFPHYDIYPFDNRPIPPDGALSSPARAAAAKGARVLDQVVPAIAAALAEAFNSPGDLASKERQAEDTR